MQAYYLEVKLNTPCFHAGMFFFCLQGIHFDKCFFIWHDVWDFKNVFIVYINQILGSYEWSASDKLLNKSNTIKIIYELNGKNPGKVVYLHLEDSSRC